ncbi:hypothetical protein WMY93_021930 [Mugilogobius chulae]|uniref:Uncharacterized protein n=1 Tax=Mugilogobius chulae TaxID=88201 RepID=A0AAW0NF79_9GOBI
MARDVRTPELRARLPLHISPPIHQPHPACSGLSAGASSPASHGRRDTHSTLTFQKQPEDRAVQGGEPTQHLGPENIAFLRVFDTRTAWSNPDEAVLGSGSRPESAFQ